jgi:hypothetical protein
VVVNCWLDIQTTRTNCGGDTVEPLTVGPATKRSQSMRSNRLKMFALFALSAIASAALFAPAAANASTYERRHNATHCMPTAPASNTITTVAVSGTNYICPVYTDSATIWDYQIVQYYVDFDNSANTASTILGCRTYYDWHGSGGVCGTSATTPATSGHQYALISTMNQLSGWSGDTSHDDYPYVSVTPGTTSTEVLGAYVTN